MKVTALSAPLLILQEHQNFEYLSPNLKAKIYLRNWIIAARNYKSAEIFLRYKRAHDPCTHSSLFSFRKKWKLASKFILLGSEMILES